MEKEREKGFYRVNDIIGNRQKGIPAILPVSRSTWWNGVKSGRYPKAIKFSAGITVWRISDIQKLVDKAAR